VRSALRLRQPGDDRVVITVENRNTRAVNSQSSCCRVVLCTFAICSNRVLSLKLKLQNPPASEALRKHCGTRFVKVMRKNPERKLALARIGKAASVALTLSALACLIGCQGLSQSGGGSKSSQEIGQLVLGSASLNFGSVTPNTSKSLTLTLTNSGNKAVNIGSASVSTKYFALAAPTLPVAVPAGQSTNVSISFTPNAAAAFTATLSIGSDAANGTQTVALSGTGIGLLALNPSSESFGSVSVGTTKSQAVTITNGSASSVSISQISVNSSAFSISGMSAPTSLGASQSTTFILSFAPSSSGNASGTVTITSDAPNPSLTMAASGTGVVPGALGTNPTSLSFGNVNVGSKTTLSETITNTGGSSVSINTVAITGTGFSVSGITTPLTLNGGQSATLSVTFNPTTAGAASGNLTVTSTATNPTLTIPTSGTGTTTTVGQLGVAPNPLALGNVKVGSSSTATGTLTAVGASVTVTAASPNNSVFTIGGLSLPLTIPAGQSTNFTITFSPTTAGSAVATLTFASNAQSSTTTDTLTGTGITSHSVALSWNASTSQNISGYNVYRAPYATSCGSYAKINNQLDSGLTYTDSAVTNGSSYCYATTAVDMSNAESGYSNIVSNVQIPAQ
jgi:Cep192 domain 4/Abnormal spindle-like microcephaly-assoc'd, ASPM-SPD-2-Hydin/HYDIN/CFA65/VesB-like, Ig-like domain